MKPLRLIQTKSWVRTRGGETEAFEEMVNRVRRLANAVGLRINAAKAKVLSAQMNPSSRGTITLDDVPLE